MKTEKRGRKSRAFTVGIDGEFYMGRYIVKRLLLFIPVVLAVAILIFSLMYLIPGDPAVSVAGSEATVEQIEAVRVRLGLNDPYLIRLLKYLKNVFLHFDFGESYITSVNISSEILSRMPRTLGLGFATWVLAVLIGVPFGMMAGVKQNSFVDGLCMIVALLGVSAPTFWLALLLVLFFSLELGWLPSSGIGGIQYYILPAIAGCFNGLASNARQARSAMLEVIRSDYIVTARAKGLSNRKIIWKHALPNALFPILTTSSVGLAHICGGSVVIEKVFGIPGIGQYMLTAINARDYPIVEACTIVLSVFFAAIMLIVDILYAFIDPKIKAKYAKVKEADGNE